MATSSPNSPTSWIRSPSRASAPLAGCSRARPSTASAMIASEFPGIDLEQLFLKWEPARAVQQYIRLHQATNRKRCLYCRFMPGATLTRRATDFVVDSPGSSYFVEFRVKIARAFNGAPSIGLVDADHELAKLGSWPDDLSRPRDGGAASPFAISCCPTSGVIHVCEGGSPGEADGEGTTQRCWFSSTGWVALDEMNRCPTRWLRFGLFIQEGRLTFFRRSEGPDGNWVSSGVIRGAMPRRLLPCIFMYSFAGFAKLTFAGVSQEAPEVVPISEPGLRRAVDWYPWPPSF